MFRIIGGSAAEKAQPWLAHIRIFYKDEEGLESQGTCGGTLINTRLVLTAAHCMCDEKKQLPCKIENPDDPITYQIKIDYNVTSKFKISIGLKSQMGLEDFMTPQLREMHIFTVIGGIVHYKYRPQSLKPTAEDSGRDIALMKLHRRIDFASEYYLKPVCLPPGPRFPDTTGEVMGYVEGWGNDASSSSKCMTNELGPAPFSPCQTKTIVDSKRNEFPGCGQIRSPTGFLMKDKSHPCNKFKKFLALKENKKRIPFLPSNFTQVKILTSSLKHDCFSDNRRPKKTWCATCRPGAVPGEPGYCGPNSINKTAEQLLPLNATNWGFCLDSSACMKLSHPGKYIRPAKDLNFIYLKILENKHCKFFGNLSNVNTKKEICAGKVVQPSLGVFKHNATAFEQVDSNGEVPSSLKNSSSEGLGFVIGGGDTCQGDSGGPLIKWMGREAVIVGVVARGTSCAEQNQAGIYTRVKTKLAWIFKHADSGQCSDNEDASQGFGDYSRAKNIPTRQTPTTTTQRTTVPTKTPELTSSTMTIDPDVDYSLFKTPSNEG